MDVWWAAPDPADLSRLSAAESARAGRFRDPADAARFATVRRLARSSLAGLRFHQLCPRCGAADHGRPVVDEPDGWYLSMTHAADRCVVAVARVPVGVDVECVDAPGLAGAVRMLDRRVGRTGGEPVDRWVAFEAAAKLAGIGLSLLDAAVPFAAATSAAAVTFPSVGDDYRCAVAISGSQTAAVTVTGPA